MIRKLGLCALALAGLAAPAWARADREEYRYPGLTDAQAEELYCIVRAGDEDWLAGLEEDIYLRDADTPIEREFWERIEDGVAYCAERHGWSEPAGKAAGMFTLQFLNYLVEEPDAIDYIEEPASVLRTYWAGLAAADRQTFAGDWESDAPFIARMKASIEDRFDTDQSTTSTMLSLLDAWSDADATQKAFRTLRGWS